MINTTKTNNPAIAAAIAEFNANISATNNKHREAQKRTSTFLNELSAKCADTGDYKPLENLGNVWEPIFEQHRIEIEQALSKLKASIKDAS